MMEKFILNEKHEAVPCASLDEWTLETVDFTKVREGVEVSTVFLGINRQFGDGPPILFETMVFGGPFDQEMDRYCTWDEAVAGHAAMVAKVSEGRTV